MLIGATHLGALEPLDVEDREQLLKEKAVSHDMPLCAALYNENFNQVTIRILHCCCCCCGGSGGGNGGSLLLADNDIVIMSTKVCEL